jgi:hypothetical protein
MFLLKQVIYKDCYFVSQLANSGEFHSDELKEFNVLVDEEKINRTTVGKEDGDGKSDFSKILKIILDLCFLLTLNYLLTFIVFPGVSIQGKLLYTRV